MNNTALKLANYWRNSLADAQNSKGALSARDLEPFIALNNQSLREGQLLPEQVAALFKDEPAEQQQVVITLRPLVYQVREEHNQTRQDLPTYLTPLICRLLVTRDGLLYADSKPIIARDLLQPLAQESFTIGDQSDLDRFLTQHQSPIHIPPAKTDEQSNKEQAKHWLEYLQFCKDLFNQVAANWDRSDYDIVKISYLFKEDKPSNVIASLIALYDFLRTNKPAAPLFENYACATTRLAAENCLAANSLFSQRLGHSSEVYALAPAQRDSLSHLLTGKTADILAVNGPPGTGKTTLLLSVVASLWTQAALSGDTPPILVASSTNNQAVTNIIEAFGKDFSSGSGPFAGRWLPDIQSFGAYFPSQAKKQEANKLYQTQDFFEKIETKEYLQHALQVYLTKAATALATQGTIKLSNVIDQLQNAIRVRQKKLDQIQKAWSDLEQARQRLQQQLGPDPLTHIEKINALCQKQTAHLATSKNNLQHFQHYLAKEPFLYTLFSWLAPVAKKRLSVFQLQMDQHDTEIQQATHLEQIGNLLKKRVEQAEQALQQINHQQQVSQDLLAQQQAYLAAWSTAIASLPQATNKNAANITLDDCDNWADTSLRFEMFLLTTHYWEGRWLQELSDNLPLILEQRTKTGRQAKESAWRRWMMLTPCIVVTFHRLPSEMRCTKYDKGNFKDDYLLNFIDLLIVDEAGQVLPEVAAPSFALAKQALVIGDTQQIEPIWSVPTSVDIGNLVKTELLSPKHTPEEYASFCANGHSATNGSVMSIAQTASRYHYDAELARGMYLYEHRRCYDPIIAYCNALCYKGRLQPKRGLKKEDGLPALGYLHIAGICQQHSSGSRYNQLEAQAIAAWIKENGDRLKHHYKKELKDIIGVITPFGAQAETIRQSCAELDIKTSKDNTGITVGTVHSFQGAERPVIIFSATYSKHANGQFIDSSKSMLNVAVSRAKDSFLVFGDIDLFTLAPTTAPRGLLAQFLLADPSYELKFTVPPRSDLQSDKTKLVHLHEVQEHDDFLHQALSSASEQVQIVTPWIRLKAIQESGVLKKINEAIQRGVVVQVYTDKLLNMGVEPKYPHGQEKHIMEFTEAKNTLADQGVQICIVNKVHSKILMTDDDLLCIGSFNWLSAQRSGDYVRHETSMAYLGPDVHQELQVNRLSLEQRRVIRSLD